MPKSLKILIACGGTGGHLFPGIAVGEALVARGHQVMLLISEKKVDAEATAKYVHQFAFATMPAVAKPPTLSPRMLPFLVKLWGSIRLAKKLIRDFQADAVLGMQPRQYRAGGIDARIMFALAQCSLGAILVARSDKGVCAIALGDDARVLLRELQDRFPRAELVGGDAAFEQLVAAVIGLVEAPNLGIDLPLDVRGTAFQQRVWQALRQIPAGQTASYAQIAEAIGSPRSVRAVAGACAANTLAVAIPCHRVVRSDGGISGYRWGVARKRELLLRERVT